jgi:hypothetical protein
MCIHSCHNIVLLLQFGFSSVCLLEQQASYSRSWRDAGTGYAPWSSKSAVSSEFSVDSEKPLRCRNKSGEMNIVATIILYRLHFFV